MQLFQQSEATAALRILYLYLVDATDGITAETGEDGGQPQIDKVGGGFGNTSDTLHTLGSGHYYVTLTAAEFGQAGAQIDLNSIWIDVTTNAEGVNVGYMERASGD